jgi:hypothetical protein
MNGIGLAGKNGIPTGLVKNSWNTFAPRVGFAFDLTGKGKTVLRSGAGIFYERLGGNEMYNMGQNMVPYAYNSSVSNVYFDNPTTTWTAGTTASIPYGVANLVALTKDYRVPTALQWSLGIQQQLRENAVMTVSYVGNSNYHQTQGRNINYVDPNDTATRLGICGTTCGYSGAPPKCQPVPALSGLGNHRTHGDDVELQLQFAAGQRADYGVEEPGAQ